MVVAHEAGEGTDSREDVDEEGSLVIKYLLDFIGNGLACEKNPKVSLLNSFVDCVKTTREELGPYRISDFGGKLGKHAER